MAVCSASVPASPSASVAIT